MESKQEHITKLWQDFLHTMAGLRQRKRELMREADRRYAQKEIENIKRKLHNNE